MTIWAFSLFFSKTSAMWCRMGKALQFAFVWNWRWENSKHIKMYIIDIRFVYSCTFHLFIYLFIYWDNHINVSGELSFCLALPKTTGNTSLMMLLDSLRWYRGRARAWACNEDELSSKSSRVPGMEMSVAETWQWWWYRSRFKQMKISHPTKNSASLRISVGRRELISGRRARSI